MEIACSALQEAILCFVSRREMSQQQLAGIARFGELGRLPCGGMVVLVGQLLVPFAVGGVVIEQVHILKQLGVLHHRTRVAEVGVAADGIRRGGQLHVGNHPTVSGGKVSPTPNPFDFRTRDAVFLNALRDDVPTALFLAEQEPVARHAVLQRKGRHIKMLVRENQGWLLTVNRVDVDAEFGVGDEEVDLRLEDIHEIGGYMEVDVGGAFVERQRRKQSDQPETVVAVGMADEDMLQLSRVKAVSNELRLRTLAAVDHVQLAETADNLRGGVVPEGRLRAPATENRDGEFNHGDVNFLWVQKYK